MNCFADGDLRGYLDGELNEERRGEIAEHVANCAGCAKHLEAIRAEAEGVRGAMMALAGADDAKVDERAALARFSAVLRGARDGEVSGLGRGPEHQEVTVSGNNVGHGGKVMEMTKELGAGKRFGRSWRPAWIGAVAASILLCSLAFPSGRSLAQRFLATLRIEKVQPIRLDFSSLDGNKPLQEMFRQMISDKVVVTADEKAQAAGGAQEAGQLAGFPVRLPSARTDAAKFTVEGRHAFHMTVDRERLQEIFDQAGRPDLLLPATIDGAQVSVNVPRGVRVEYGDCPHHQEAHAEGAHQGDVHPAQGEAWSNCLALVETPSPQVNMPADLNVQQLAEIGFQLARMSPTQARELAQSIDWKTTLVLPLPRFAGSYSQVQVSGVSGTLISNGNGGGRRGPDYVLMWVKNGIIYGLVGHGDASNAIALGNSLS